MDTRGITPKAFADAVSGRLPPQRKLLELEVIEKNAGIVKNYTVLVRYLDKLNMVMGVMRQFLILPLLLQKILLAILLAFKVEK